MSDATAPIARRVIARGRVQGVFFRASTRDEAVRAGVSGWVRNRPDGAVEAWLEGTPQAVATVEDWIRRGGPPRAHVEDVEVASQTPAGRVGFDVQ